MLSLYHEDNHLIPFRPLLFVLLMNLPDLLLNIHVLHLRQPRCVFALRLPIIARCGLLPSRCFLLSNGLAGHAVEDVAALRGEALEVIGDFRGGEVGSGVSRFGFGSLFLPARVKHFDYWQSG
jgi:hypothetical protein